MIDCEEARQRWHLRFDEGGEDAELDEHLASCEACGQYARQMRGIVDLLEELRGETEQVVARRDEGPPVEARCMFAASRLTVLTRLTRIAAAVAVLVAGGLYLGNLLLPTGSPTPEDRVVVTGPALAALPTTVRLEGESARRYLAVSHPTADANVQMVWLYPSLHGAGDDDRS